ncbi:MAG: sulfatase, partial [Persicimonas sp.]
MNRRTPNLLAYLSLLIGAGILQTVAGGILGQWVEGWTWDGALSIFQSVVYPVPALVVFFALAASARAIKRRNLSATAAVAIAASTALPLFILSAYAAFRLAGIDTIFFSVWGAAIALYVAIRMGVPRLSRPQAALALVPGWLVALPVLVIMERRYELLASMSDEFLDPNAQLLCILAALTLLAGAALAPWFAPVDEEPKSRSPQTGWTATIGGCLLVAWAALLWANRVVLLPRLYPEVHGALAFFELVLLVGALGWLSRRRLSTVDLGSKRAVSVAAIPVVLVALSAISLLYARPDAVVPRRVDTTAHFFAQPWAWAFDRDGDGYLSYRLGGIDCDDGDADVGPLGREIAGDGVDQNCSGEDLGTERARVADDQPPIHQSGPEVDLAIVVSIDMLRPDFMGVYGADEQTTPFLSRTVLSQTAAEWTRFDRAYTSGGITTLALPSLLSGRIPLAVDFEPVLRTTDLRYVFPDERDDHTVNRVFASPRSDRHPTVGEVFQRADRRTYGIVDDGPAAVFQKGFGFEKGFDSFDYPNAPEGPGEDGWGARQVTDAARQAASRAPEGSLMWLHYYDPHSATERYCDAFGITPGLGCYRDAIRHVDAMLADLVEHLREIGRWERTLMIITSDHGEALGEHGLRHHGLDSYEEFVRIPLLLKAPGGDLPETSDAPVSLIDVAPTLVAASGLAPPATFQGDDLRLLARGEARRYP